jgi:hypothetical protein
MEVSKSGDRVTIEMSKGEALLFAARIGEAMGISQDELDEVFEEVLS